MRKRDEQPDELEELLRIGTVKSVDHATGKVVVTIGELETDEIRWAERRGGGTKTWSPPSVGEQMLLFCPSGEMAGAVAIASIPSEANPYPGNSKRELVTFEDGAELAYDPEAHRLDVTLPDGATIFVTSTGGVTIDCTDGGLTITAPTGGVTIDASDGGVAITGDLSVDGEITATGDVIADTISLQNHTHGGVEAGGSSTGLPE